MLQSKHKNYLLALFTGLLILGSGYLAYIYQSPKLTPPELPVDPPVGEISVLGMMVCLPHRDTRGPQTLECAFGVKDGAGRYYALRDTDPSYKNVSGVPMNVPVEVKGIFTPKEDTKYQSIGVIEVASITRTDIPQRISIEGTYICLPHKDTTGPQTEECAFGIKTDDGVYYALDFNLASQLITNFKAGDRVSLSGVFTPLELLSTNQWDKYPIKGILSVTNTKADFFSCTTDSDCISVRADSCGCTAGGKAISINNNYTSQWEQQHPRGICTTVMSGDWTCVNSTPKCVNNQCQLVKRL